MVDEGELNRGDRQTYWQQQYLDARAAGNRDMKSILAHMRGNGGEGGTTGHDITRPAAADIVRAQEQRHGAKPPGKPPTGGQAVQGGEEPRRGQVDRSQVKHILKHELDTANLLADLEARTSRSSQQPTRRGPTQNCLTGAAGSSNYHRQQPQHDTGEDSRRC